MKNAIKYMLHGKDVTDEAIEKAKEELIFINSKLSKIIEESSVTCEEACYAVGGFISDKMVINNNISCYKSATPERPARVKCVYCDCVNNKDYGTCDFCGAPLKI